MSLDPAILFFVFGVLAGFARSNIEVPPQISRFLSLYLLMALGLEGGFELARSGLTTDIAASLGAAMLMAFIVPLIGYSVLKHRISRYDAAAIAAAYGSVSAVTFVSATSFLEDAGLAPGGHMTFAMLLMESPAIVMAVALASVLRGALTAPGHDGPVTVALAGDGRPRRPSLGEILHDSFTDGAHLLVIGAAIVGLLSGEAGHRVMEPFAGDLFKGMLAFFLLDMGLLVARKFDEARRASPVLIAYALLAPPLHAGMALALAWMLALPVSDTALLMVLSASASYIVVPAVLRYAIPEANPSLYFGLSLGISLPFNLLVGIPVYTRIALAVSG